MTNNQHEDELAAMLVLRRSDILERWLAQVQADVRARNVEATALQNAIPDYLTRITESLTADGTPSEHGIEAWREVAREHALTRVRLGFDVDQLVQEFIILRRVLLDVVHEEKPKGPAQLEKVVDLIESAIAEAVRAYVESRDYHARRRMAEHVGFLTHQLRNPLSTIRLLVEHLEPTSFLPAKQLDSLKRNVARLNDLIDEALTSQQLEAGALEPRLVRSEVATLLEAPLASARLSAAEKGLSLEVRFDIDPGAEALVDTSLTTTAFENLLDNAIKYTDKGRILVRVDEHLGEFIIHVRDSCGGISGMQVRDLFEPFVRGTSNKPGTGLGLAIARRAVEAQGGTIDVSLTTGVGCEFSFSLLRYDATEKIGKGSERHGDDHGAQRRAGPH